MTDAIIQKQTLTERTVNGHRYDMEMELLAAKEINAAESVQQCANDFLIVSYFFDVRTQRNYCFEPLIKCLKYIRQPNTMKTFSKSTICPFPLDRIVLPSESGFYGYQRQHRECRIQHFIEANRLIPIGDAQMSEFNKLARINGGESGDGPFTESVRSENRLNSIKLVHYTWQRRSPRNPSANWISGSSTSNK